MVMKMMTLKSMSQTTGIVGSLILACAAAPAFAGNNSSYGAQLSGPNALPTHAAPGHCYARVKHDAQYATESQIITVADAYQKIEVTQAQLVSRQEQIVVKEPSVRFEVRQPSYRTVNEQIMTRPAYEKLSVSKPQFKTVEETVMVSAPRVVWKRGNPGALAAQGYNVLSTLQSGSSGASTSSSYGSGVSGSGYSSHNATGHSSGYNSASNNQCGPECEIWCLVEEPGESVTYNRKVLASPGQVQRQSVPAKYTSVSRQVVSDPGGVREIPVPAQYRSITVEDVVTPGGQRLVPVPAQTGKVAKKNLIQPESYEWMRVICNTGQVISSAPANFTPPPTYAAPAYVAPIAVQPSIAPCATGTSLASDGTCRRREDLPYAPVVPPLSSLSSGSYNTGSYNTGSYNTGSYSSGTYSGASTSQSATDYSYYNNPPSSLSYSSTTHGTSHLQNAAEPRIYGGEGLNSHHSASHNP